jgi:hypothetical protein
MDSICTDEPQVDLFDAYLPSLFNSKPAPDCASTCLPLPNAPLRTFCTVLCQGVGPAQFRKEIQRFVKTPFSLTVFILTLLHSGFLEGIHPVSICQDVQACPRSASAAVQIQSLSASPSVAVTSSKTLIQLQFNAVETTGVVEVGKFQF